MPICLRLRNIIFEKKLAVFIPCQWCDQQTATAGVCGQSARVGAMRLDGGFWAAFDAQMLWKARHLLRYLRQVPDQTLFVQLANLTLSPTRGRAPDIGQSLKSELFLGNTKEPQNVNWFR